MVDTETLTTFYWNYMPTKRDGLKPCRFIGVRNC